MNIWKQFGPNIRFFAEGDGEGGGGEPWHSQFSYFTDNPKAVEAVSKYKDSDAFCQGAHEAIKKVGRPFWLPEDHSKLTDDQKSEIKANVAKMDGVPTTPDGYKIKLREGSTVDDKAMADFRVLAHGNRFSEETVQSLIDFQDDFVGRLNTDRMEAIKGLTKKNFDRYAKEEGGPENAALHMQYIREYLQSLCVDDEGRPDKDQWESVEKRLFYEDKGIEYILMKALAPEAQKKRGTGGAPAGQSAGAEAVGALSYPEMKTKK